MIVLVRNAADIRFLWITHEVTHQQKFIDCKTNAQPLGDKGLFNVCEDKDLGGIGTTVIQVIVYDTTDTFIAPCDNKPAWEARVKKLYLLTQAPYEVKEITKDYYLLSFTFDGSNHQPSKC